ncbi:hypothetical protein T439DRAFT_158879 [Meredithblackwellia eburnea MCA 4105]
MGQVDDPKTNLTNRFFDLATEFQFTIPSALLSPYPPLYACDLTSSSRSLPLAFIAVFPSSLQHKSVMPHQYFSSPLLASSYLPRSITSPSSLAGLAPHFRRINWHLLRVATVITISFAYLKLKNLSGIWIFVVFP